MIRWHDCTVEAMALWLLVLVLMLALVLVQDMWGERAGWWCRHGMGWDESVCTVDRQTVDRDSRFEIRDGRWWKVGKSGRD